MKIFAPILLFGILLLAGPIVAGALKVDIPMVSNLLMTGFGLVMVMISGIALVIAKLYVKTRADEAFVKTGMGGRKVIMDGGALVLPVIHDTVRVSLRTIRLQVERRGTDALLTGDKLRADVCAEFFVKVPPVEEAVLNAARSLGERLLRPDEVKAVVEDKLVSALRTVAAKTSLQDLNSDRDTFMSQVVGIIKSDLEQNGLVLETATISKLDQTPTSSLNQDNIFDAQGLRTIAQITEEQKTQKNALTRAAEQERAKQDVETRKRILAFDQDRAEAEATQKSAIASKEAEEGRKSQEAKIAQQRSVEIAEAQKQQALEVVAQERQQAGEVAQRKRLEAVARADAEQVVAEADKSKAEALSEKERQNVQTVQVTAEAERDKLKSVIGASAAAETAYVTAMRKADSDAYGAQKSAEGRKAAANVDAEATIRKAEADAKAVTTKAEADKFASLARAEGKRVEDLIPVSIQQALVDVRQREVDIEKARVADVLIPELQAREQHGAAAQAFELEKQRIEAHARVEIQLAQALGGAFGRVNMEVFGTPEDAGRMLQQLTSGMGFARKVNGFADELGPDGKAILAAGASGVGSMLKAVASRLGLNVADVQAAVDAVQERKGNGSADPKDGPAS